MADPLLGYKVRAELYPGEDKFFRENPTVGGMASESGHIILNPYSPASVNREAVARNEALRLYMRENKITPDFEIAQKQREAFKGTAYEKDENALRETIAGRVYSGDPSAMATEAQREWVQKLIKSRKSTDQERAKKLYPTMGDSSG